MLSCAIIHRMMGCIAENVSSRIINEVRGAYPRCPVVYAMRR